MIFGIEPVQRRANVVNLTVSVVMFTLAESGATKVKPQHRKSKTVQRLHRVKHNLVVQRPAKQWMRMTNYCRVRGIVRSGIQQRLQPSSRSVKKKVNELSRSESSRSKLTQHREKERKFGARSEV